MIKKIKKYFDSYFILFTVFLTGVCGLVIEIVGMRVLSPYFGNTIFTTSSVISVFLAALSFGYYYGGVLVDKNPSSNLFYKIIFYSGMSVLFTQLFRFLFLPHLGQTLSIVEGPFVSSVILFLIPGMLLGMVSPFAIKLQKEKFKNVGIGKTAGKVFFWSTFGSIFGSLITGFVLIPNIGINTIILSTAVVLLLIGGIPLMSELRKSKNSFFLTFLITALFALLLSPAITEEKRAHIFQKEGLYQLITLVDEVQAGRPIRTMYLDLNRSGAVYQDSSTDLVFEYTKYFDMYTLWNVDLKNALFIGGGSYALPSKLLETNSEVLIDVVEIEPDLYEISQEYLGIIQDPRMQDFTEDGRRFLSDSQKKYDYIFSDAYLSHYSVPTHLTTKEFFELSKSKLNDDGIIILNIIGSINNQRQSFLLSEMKTFQSVFSNNIIFSVNPLSKNRIQNYIFVGLNGNKKIDLNDQKIRNSSNPFITSLPQKAIFFSEAELANQIIFTDDYAPTDYLIAHDF